MFDLPNSDILPLSLQHSFWTWSAQAKVNPIPVTRAQGVYFWDADGKRYLDFNSMTMCVNIGHGNQRVIEAIVEQARALPYAAPGMATKPRAMLGKLLSEITPGEPAALHVHPGRGGCQRERGQAGARLHRPAQDPDPLPLLPRRLRRRHGADRRPAPPSLGANPDARRGAFPRSLPLPLHLPPHQSRTSPKRISPRITSTTWKRSSSTKARKPSPPSCWNRSPAPTASSSRRRATCPACGRCATNTAS